MLNVINYIIKYMAIDKKCPLCSQNLKVVPAGISKNSGKKYDAFYACKNKCNLRGMMDTRVEGAVEGFSKPSFTPKQGGVDLNVEIQMKLDTINKTVSLILEMLNREVGDGEV